MGERFFFVMGNGMPTVRHPSYQAAMAEAERLARKDQGQEFLVLAAVAKVRRTDVVVEILGQDDPFDLDF